MNTDRRRWCVAAGLCWAGRAVALPEAEPVLESLALPDARLELQFAPGFDPPLRAAARVWIERSAMAVSGYFGRFPVAAAEILVIPADGGGVRSGNTSHGDASLLVRVRLGRQTTPAQLRADWIMVHEMVHLAVPRVPRSQSWLHEGIATYVEGVARAHAGLLPPAEVWREWRRAMPQGQPQADDRGLDHTPTWGRTYWGGALFCMLADIEIRKRTENRIGLQDALKGVLAETNFESRWPIEQALRAGDGAVGLDVLMSLYGRMRDKPEAPDLAALWKELGVAVSGRTVGFDPSASGAGIRSAIVSLN